MTSKRHAKPTALQLVERSYRHVIGLKRVLMKDATENRQLIRNDLKGIYDYIAEMDRHIGIQERTLRSHVLALADHCARLLREKETLQRIVTEMKDSATYMSHPLKLWEHTTECTTANSARIANGEFRQCICGADEWKEKLAANVYNADFKP
jgi:hypothetical protein